MTRYHVDEVELVDLQRKALELYQRFDDICGNAEGRVSESDMYGLESTQALAREVSDLVDALTEYVRHNRMAHDCLDDDCLECPAPSKRYVA